MNINLCFLGTRGIINVAGIVWGSQHLCHYVTCTLGSVFFVLTITVLWFTSPTSQGQMLQLLRVEAIIMAASNRWIDIRHFSLFLSIELGVEI